MKGKTWEYPKEQRKRKKLDFAITKVNINFVCAFSLFSQSEQSAWKSSEKGLIYYKSNTDYAFIQIHADTEI